MNKLFLPLLLLSLAFVSCAEEPSDNSNKYEWGTRRFYSDFLWCQYDVTDTANVMCKTLCFDFNQEAKNYITDNVEFQLVERVVKQNDTTRDIIYLPAKGIIIFKNDIECDDNILQISIKEEKAKLKIIFTKDTEKKDHTYIFCLKVINNGGLDRIGNIDVSEANTIYFADEWIVRKEYVYNPLAKGLFWSVVGLITFLLLWYVLSRRINPNNKFSKIYFDYNDGQGEQERRGVGNCYKIVCTNKKQRISLFHKFFVGNITFETNDFWTYPVTLKSGTRNNIKLSGLVNYELDNEETIRTESFIITNENGQKVIITTT